MAYLYLESGMHLTGEAFGADTTVNAPIQAIGGLCRVREVLRQNLFAGQIAVLPSALLSRSYTEEHVQGAVGLVLREYDRSVDDGALVRCLTRFGIPAICDLDVRLLQRAMRENPEGQRAVISVRPLSPAALDAHFKEPAQLRAHPETTISPGSADRVAVLGSAYMAAQTGGLCDATVGSFPASVTLAELEAFAPTAIIVCAYVNQAVEPFVGKVPILAVGRGYALVSRLLGLEFVAMPLQHAGCNIPVKQDGGQILITQQNHRKHGVWSQNAACRVTHSHLTDNTMEGYVCDAQNVRAVTFIPGESPETGSEVLEAFITHIQEG